MYTIFHNTTRGSLYGIMLQMTSEEDAFPGTFQIVETKHGQQTGFANLGQTVACDAIKEYNRRIDEYAKYDGIFFTKTLMLDITPLKGMN